MGWNIPRYPPIPRGGIAVVSWAINSTRKSVALKVLHFIGKCLKNRQKYGVMG